MNEELSHTEDMTIEDFLSGATAYEIADNALKRVLVKRKIAFGTMVSELTERQLDLATADIYMWCASTPSSKNDTEDSDGGWKHKEGGWQTSAYDKRQLREMAKELYEYIIAECKKSVPNVAQGEFGADMKVELLNDGPFTILLDSAEL